ncbi:MAG: hypothetical protein JSV63_01180 [Candidatus Aenigmatarchaeota archaeon]|nr:MAG: hypothetical protein JSV63_01180 [Candidatus Aenigmarchaeota archaeon]
MDEIKEVESELRRLREEAVHFKRAAEHASKEKKTLEAKNDYLVNKLKEASYVYGEAGKRLLYFINNQVNPVTKRLNDLDARDRKLSSDHKTLGESLISMEKTLKDDFTKTDKRLLALSEEISALQERMHRALKSSVRKSEKYDLGLEEKLGAALVDFDNAMKALKVAMDRKTTTRLNLLEKKTDSKMDTLREQNLLMGKDIEALKKFEGDIEGLEGKLQTTVANLTQTRLDMEGLAQRVKGEMGKTKIAVDNEMELARNDVDQKLAALSATMADMNEKNLSIIRAEVRKQQQAFSKKIKENSDELVSFEDSVNSAMKNTSEDVKNQLAAFNSGIEKRLSTLEAGLNTSSKNQKDMERIFNEKFESSLKHSGTTDERIDNVEATLSEHLSNFKELTKRREMVLKNELNKIGKAADQKIGHASLELERKIALLTKDIDSVRAFGTDIGKVITELEKTKEESASLRARMNSISQDITNKSEKADMIIKKQLEMLQAEVKNSLDAAEARIVKENVRSFSQARHNLKKDVHSLREDNAALKAEIKNLRSLGDMVSDIRQAVVDSQKKSDEALSTVEQMSAGISAEVEKQALKMSKDLTEISAGLQADMKDTLAKEKQRFASQSAELDTRYSELAEMTAGLRAESKANYTTSASNKKNIASLEKKIGTILNEIVGLKKEYKTEMGKLLRELEG